MKDINFLSPKVKNNEMESIIFLEHASVEDWGCLLRSMSIVAFEAGKVIINKGDEDNYLGFVLTGELEIFLPQTKSQDPVKLSNISPGSVFGEQSFIDNRKRSASIRAVTDVELYKLDQESFNRLSKENPSIAFKLAYEIAKILSLRLRNTTESLVADKQELKVSILLKEYQLKHDNLTGLPNRKFYNEYMAEAYMSWKSGLDTLTIGLIDIDKFKLINDTYGHLTGDLVLKDLSSLLKSSTRSNDFVARYGGEEFVVIFKNTSIRNTYKIAEKLRKAIQKHVVKLEGKSLKVTISLGITEIIQNDTIDSFFSRADEALYAAKNSGRNQVVVGQPCLEI